MAAYKRPERLQQLRDWLNKVEATVLAQASGPNDTSKLIFYRIKGHVFIIQEFWSRDGENLSWDMYLPASTSAEIAQIFTDAEQWLSAHQIA